MVPAPVPPSASTIDYELSKVLPETLLPHLCIGMDSMENMKAKPTVANLSASGAGQPIFMHSNPNHLYEMLYGGISDGDIRQQHEARDRARIGGRPGGLRRRGGHRANSTCSRAPMRARRAVAAIAARR